MTKRAKTQVHCLCLLDLLHPWKRRGTERGPEAGVRGAGGVPGGGGVTSKGGACKRIQNSNSN